MTETQIQTDSQTAKPATQGEPSAHLDAITWFEIPTLDLVRAIRFYELVLNVRLRRDFFGEEMALFPSTPTAVGGALVQREWQQPSAAGSLVYLNCDAGVNAGPEAGLDAALARLETAAPGSVIVPKTPVPGGFGSFACIRDSEGNHVGLHQH